MSLGFYFKIDCKEVPLVTPCIWQSVLLQSESGSLFGQVFHIEDWSGRNQPKIIENAHLLPSRLCFVKSHLSVWKQYQFKVFLAPLPETSHLLPTPPQSRQLFARTYPETDWLADEALRNLPDFFLSNRSVLWSSSQHRHIQLSRCKWEVDTGAEVKGSLTSIAKHFMQWRNMLGEVSAQNYFHHIKA